jgi:hypothetical protein
MVVRRKKPPKTGEKSVADREPGRTSIGNAGNTTKKFVPPTV